MKILVIGGTGFIGYPVVKKLSAQGHEVTVFTLPGENTVELFDESVRLIECNKKYCGNQWLEDQLCDIDSLVFAAGTDDRFVPKAPAFEFLFKEHVMNTLNLFLCAKDAGVKQAILIGSYFAYFDRRWPELKLSDKHPHIRTRHEQEQVAQLVCRKMKLCVLELPFVFGAKPRSVPLWSPFINYVRSGLPLICSEGGTNIVAVEQVAEATVGAVNTEADGIFQVGDENITWQDLCRKIAYYCGREVPEPKIMPNFYLKQLARLSHQYHQMRGGEFGIDLVEFAEVQARESFFDSKPAKMSLGYTGGGLDQAIKDTVEACPKNEHVVHIQQFVDWMETNSLWRWYQPFLGSKNRQV